MEFTELGRGALNICSLKEAIMWEKYLPLQWLFKSRFEPAHGIDNESEKKTMKEFTNNDVYKFLTEECRQFETLWEKYGDGITNYTTDADFWESLSEELDCFRICDECGKPMIVGYVVNGDDTYCSDECLHKHLTDEKFNELYDDGNSYTYWTTWYEDSKTFKQHE